MYRSKRLLLIAILLLAFLTAGCIGPCSLARLLSGERVEPTPSTAAPPARRGATLNLPGADPPTLDPALTMDATSAEYIVEIFSGLVTLNKDLELVPDIAESWDISQEGTVYTFHLSRDASFHDGKQVTAYDFKYSIERACDPEMESVVADTYLGDIVGAKEKLRGQADEVSGVVVLDDHTLEIKIDAPKPYFLYKLTYPTAFVLDKENVEGIHQPWTDRPNGTGSFRLEEYELGQRIVLLRNELYYDEELALERVNFILAGGSAMTMYENGELDAVPVGLTDIERVLDTTNPLNKELTIAPILGTFYIGFNVNKPPFDDVKVRQAFNYAIDKQKIVDVVYKKTVPAAKGIVPPIMPNYSNENLVGYPYDPAKARQLIAESKYGDVSNFPEIILDVSGGGGAAARQVEAIVEMLKDNLGVDVVIEQSLWATYLDDLKAHRYQMFGVTSGWIADYPDPQDFLDILFHSESFDNNHEYSNPEVDRLLEEARVEQDPDKRMEMYQQVEQMIIDDAVWAPLSHGTDYWLTKPYVKGMIYPAIITPKLRYVSISR